MYEAVFFLKPKTAYEMRISDLSSDVCSSVLASHDLRQPLHAIELFVAALEGTTDVGEVRAIVGDLREACNATGRLLNALLDVSELESGKRGGSSIDRKSTRLNSSH